MINLIFHCLISYLSLSLCDFFLHIKTKSAIKMFIIIECWSCFLLLFVWTIMLAMGFCAYIFFNEDPKRNEDKACVDKCKEFYMCLVWIFKNLLYNDYLLDIIVYIVHDMLDCIVSFHLLIFMYCKWNKKLSVITMFKQENCLNIANIANVTFYGISIIFVIFLYWTIM